MAILLGPIPMLILIILIFSLLVVAIYLAIKNEKDFYRILWILFIIIFLIVGPLIYIAKYLLSKKS